MDKGNNYEKIKPIKQSRKIQLKWAFLVVLPYALSFQPKGVVAAPPVKKTPPVEIYSSKISVDFAQFTSGAAKTVLDVRTQNHSEI